MLENLGRSGPIFGFIILVLLQTTATQLVEIDGYFNVN